MATTTTKDTPIARTHEIRPDEGDPREGDWKGPKLVVLGVIELLIALAFLYTISPYAGVLLP